MGINLVQDDSASAAFVDDKSGLNAAYMDPNSRLVSRLRFTLNRTTFGTQVGLLPPGAVPTRLQIFGAAASASSTTAPIVIGVDTTTNYFLTGFDVKVAANGSGQVTPNQATNLNTALATLPNGQFHPVTAAYSEVSTSASGGPWYVELDFYVPLPA